MIERRWVFDTNVLVSRLLNPGGTAARAVDMGMDSGVVLLSDATFSELAQVLMRPKFDPYLTRDERAAALDATAAVCRRVLISRPLRACRDPQDDKFLDVAVHGSADALVTGDADLLALHPFHGVPILTPSHFLEEWLPRVPSGGAPKKDLQ
jgi:putative PIN family toxin of toxin-antitoxin system